MQNIPSFGHAYKSRVRFLFPGYEGIGAGVRGYWSRGTRVLEPRYESIGAGVAKEVESGV